MRSGVGFIASAYNAAAAYTDVLTEPFNNLTFAPWTTVAGTPTIVAGGRTSNGLEMGGTTDRIRYSLAAGNQVTTLTIGCAYKVDSLATVRPIVTLQSDSGATSHVTLRVNADGSLSVCRGTVSGSVLRTTATGLIVINTWYYLELQATLHDTNGSATIRRNNTQVDTASSLDTKNAGTKTVFDAVEIPPAGTGGVAITDDLYIRAGTSAPFRGDITV